MKKNNFFFVAMWGLTTSVFAASVDVNHAMQVAQNFYQQTSGKALALTLTYEQLNADTTNGLPIGVPFYYVFSASNKQGYVIVSAEDAAKPILGYSTKGDFIIQGAPPAITDWFKKYCIEIAYAKANGIVATPDILSQWANNGIADNGLRSESAVPALLSSTWDQDLYYNALCPPDGESVDDGYGGRCATGCGATAMAQIMNYWVYPASGTGSNQYTSNYGTLSANFGTTTYNWANMPNSVDSDNIDVATLMFDCGVAVNMNYGPPETGGSGSDPVGPRPSSQAAYTNFFQYDGTLIQGLLKNDTDETDWLNIIQNELNNGRPIQYAGFVSSGEAGHTFVLDGSDGNGNFHINWGWSGTDDGFYGIDALNPPGQETFNTNEEMIIGIQPLNFAADSADIQISSQITVSPGNPVPFRSNFTISANVINDGSATFNGYYSASLFDGSGNLVRYIGSVLEANGLPPGQTESVAFTDSVATGLTIPGDYTVGIYYITPNGSIWDLVGSTSYSNPVTVTFSGPYDSIQLYSDIVFLPATLIQGEAAGVSVNLWNTGTTTYYGQYEAALLDFTGSVIEQVIGTYTESTGLGANTDYEYPYITLTTNSITIPEGDYILAILERPSGTNTWYYCGTGQYTNPINVSVVNTGFFTSVNSTLSNNTIKLYPNPVNDVLTIDAGELSGNYTLRTFNVVGQEMNESNGILSGQKLSENVSHFAAGIYTLQLKTETDNISGRFIVR